MMVVADLLVENCRILRRERGPTSIAVAAGKINAIGSVDSADERLDAGGRVVTPGLIDLHVQGAGGADVLDGESRGLETISRTLARFGITGFLATTVFHPDRDNEHIAAAVRASERDLGGATILGLHLEGPFISTEKRGMISPQSICQPDPEILREILRLCRGKLTMMTVAPELSGIGEVMAGLHDNGIISSFGHSNASYEETLLGIKRGVSHVTHLFNAMPPLHHREPGPLLAILESQVTAQLISDGIHVHPSVVRWVFGLMGRDRIVPITDGVRAMGLPDGQYLYDGVEFHSKQGAARYRDGTLIGTSLGMDSMVRRLHRFTGCDMATAIETATKNPARILGMESKGSIGLGMDADLVIWDPGFRVWATLVNGVLVHGPVASGHGDTGHHGKEGC